MSRWASEFEVHPIHEAVRQLIDWSEMSFEGETSDTIIEQKRLLKIFDLIRNTVGGLDPEIFPVAPLIQLNQQLRSQQVWNQIEAYSQSGELSNLQAANNHLTGQIPAINQIAAITKQPEARAAIIKAEKASESFINDINAKKEEIQKSIQDNEGRLDDLSQQLDQQKLALKTLSENAEASISTWQSEFVANQITNVEEHSQAQIDRQKQFDEKLREFATNIDQQSKVLSEKYEENLEEVFSKFKTQTDAKNVDIHLKHKSILDIHELVATDGVAGGYKKHADTEKAAADTWRRISMFCYALILLWAILKARIGFSVVNGDKLDWSAIVTVISVTAVAFVAAQFASKQSRLHRMNEQRMRWFSLEVKAIDPFISSLPIEMQQELKRQLSERLFGQDRVLDEKPNKGVQNSTVEKMVEGFSNAVTEVVKSRPG